MERNFDRWMKFHGRMYPLRDVDKATIGEEVFKFKQSALLTRIQKQRAQDFEIVYRW
jgi:hypothetical protein